MNMSHENGRTWQGWIADAATMAVSVSALAMVGLAFWNHFADPSPNLAQLREDREIDGFMEVASAGQWMGPEEAEVVIVEFGDYECPFCRRAEGPLRYVREVFPEKVAVVYRHFPLRNHPNAYEAARLAECGARQNRFEQVHQLLFSAVSLANLDPGGIAGAVEAPDSSSFVRCATETGEMARIEEDIKAAEELQIGAVPAIILQGTLLGTPPDSTTLIALVRQELGRVEE